MSTGDWSFMALAYTAVNNAQGFDPQGSPVVYLAPVPSIGKGGVACFLIIMKLVAA